jgi:hypothetical protein
VSSTSSKTRTHLISLPCSSPNRAAPPTRLHLYGVISRPQRVLFSIQPASTHLFLIPCTHNLPTSPSSKRHHGQDPRNSVSPSKTSYAAAVLGEEGHGTIRSPPSSSRTSFGVPIRSPSIYPGSKSPPPLYCRRTSPESVDLHTLVTSLFLKNAYRFGLLATVSVFPTIVTSMVNC